VMKNLLLVILCNTLSLISTLAASSNDVKATLVQNVSPKYSSAPFQNSSPKVSFCKNKGQGFRSRWPGPKANSHYNGHMNLIRKKKKENHENFCSLPVGSSNSDRNLLQREKTK